MAGEAKPQAKAKPGRPNLLVDYGPTVIFLGV